MLFLYSTTDERSCRPLRSHDLFTNFIFLFSILSILSLFTSFVTPAGAETAGNPYAPRVITLGLPTETDSGYTVSNIINITESGYYKIRGSGQGDRVVVNSGVSADIILENATLDVRHLSHVCAFEMMTGTTVKLSLAGTNFVMSHGAAAGIQVPPGAALTITSAGGDGSLYGYLKAIGMSGAGIGGDYGQAAGSITINGGTIEARGSDGEMYGSGAQIGGGAGIGGGHQGDGGTITINGGKVYVDLGSEDWGAAGIGGGGGDTLSNISGRSQDAGGAGTITINGGFVRVVAPRWSAAIGSGYTPKNNDGIITITGGVVQASAGVDSAAIGAGYDGDGGVITISGGHVEATSLGGVSAPAAIGAAGGINALGGNAGNITISGGLVVALGEGSGSPIGPASGSLAYGGNNGGQITLSGGTIFALSNQTLPAGSIGYNPLNGPSKTPVSITGTGGNRPILLATGVWDSVSSSIYSPNGSLGFLTSPDLTYPTPRTVILSNDLTIPAGATLTVPETYTLTVTSGHSIHNLGLIVNKGAVGATISGGGAVITFNNKVGSVAGNAVLSGGFYLAPDEILEIPSGAKVTVPAGVRATNDGKIVVRAGGELNVTGTLIDNGLIQNWGTINGASNISGIGGTLTWNGTDTWTASASAPLPEGFTIGKGEKLVVPTGATAIVSIRTTIINDGTIDVQSGGKLLVYGTLISNGTVTNNGIVDNKGTINNYGTVLDNGLLINEQDAVINNRYTGLKQYNGAAIPFALIHITGPGGVLDNYGTINNDGTILIDGLFTNQPGGTVNNNQGALIHITDDGTLDNYGTINNHGTIEVDGHLHNQPGGTINNYTDGTIEVNDGGIFDNDGTLINDGKININDGGVFNNNPGGIFDNSGGTVNISSGGTFNDNGGTFIDNDPANDASGSGSSSTDFTWGPVRLNDEYGMVFAESYMIRQSDGTWLINVPYGVGGDLSRVGLTFTLPDARAQVDPKGGELRNFSGGQAVPYTVISGDGNHTVTYQVRLKVQVPPVQDGTLVDPDPAHWTLDQSQNADGTYSFTVEAPLAEGIFPNGTAHIYASLGGNYSYVTLVTTTGADGVPVLRITGTAQTLTDLQNLSISRIEWSLTDGSEYAQNLNPPATYFTIGVGGSVDDGADDKTKKKGGGGCAATGSGTAAALLFALTVMKNRKRALGALFLSLSISLFAFSTADAATAGSPCAPKIIVLGSGHVITITQDGYYRITGTNQGDRVVVATGVSADVLLDNATIDVSAFDDACAFDLTGATVKLRLAGTNVLKSNGVSAGLQAPAGSTLTITSAYGDGSLAGSLTAVGTYGAGIGGDIGRAAGHITINGGTIQATGSDFSSRTDNRTNIGGGAGLGGGYQGDGGTLVINGGALSADLKGTDWGAACIGGGGGDAISVAGNYSFDAGEAGDITITGGFVKATAPSWSAGIGSGYTPKNGNTHGKITIAGGVVTASSAAAAAGIGGGQSADGGIITISGGFVDARSPGGIGDSAAIGGTWGGAGYGNAGVITITGGSVIAVGGTGPAIGPGSGKGGSVSLTGGSILALSGLPIGENNGGFASVDITSGDLVLLSTGAVESVSTASVPVPSYYPSDGSHGILLNQKIYGVGGVGLVLLLNHLKLNFDNSNKTITLEDEDHLTVPAGATLAVPAGWTLNLNARSLTNNGLVLNKGNITGGSAAGARMTFDGNGRATLSGNAVLSEGFYLAPGEILTIPAGQSVTIPAGVKATNDGIIIVEAGGALNVNSAGTLINRGLVWNKGGTVTGNTNNSAGFDTGGTLTWNGSDTWTVSGVAPLPVQEGFTVAAGQILNIPAGATAVVPFGVTLVNDGTITVQSGGKLLIYGTLTNRGTTDNGGTLDNKGTFDNYGTIMDNGTFINEQGAVVNNKFTDTRQYNGASIPFALIHVTSSGRLDNYGTINNDGTILIDGLFTNQPDGTVNNNTGALIHITDGG
ncbi:MAG: hypothetical protein LBR61_09220, partial [Synergistaceae bacterium]|nr:hypothetical protein [Synergistaceae bacterium]